MQYHPMNSQLIVPPIGPHVPPHAFTHSNQQPPKKYRIFYCWTHRACLHSEDHCIITRHQAINLQLHSKIEWVVVLKMSAYLLHKKLHQETDGGG